MRMMSLMKIRASFWSILPFALALAGVVLWRTSLLGAEAPVVIAPPAVDNPKAAGPSQTAVLAGGCFWGVQGVYEHVRGVRSVLAGYSGGDKAAADYETVSSGTTGHAESVKIVFDPAEISQRRIAQAYIAQLNQAHAFSRPIVTRVDPLRGFFTAEGYHQDYLYRNPNVPYIAMFDMPKIENFKRTFPELYRGRPVLTRNEGSP
jgi:peptide-methionine (S)-S-oxide reductase